MKRHLPASLLLFLCLTAQLYAKDYALILAGGCDNTLSQEMFEESFSFADGLIKRGWDVKVLHSNSSTRADLNKTYDRNKGAFTTRYEFSKYKIDNFTREAIKSSLSTLASNVKKGDQVLINIITHGLPVSSAKGHIICLAEDPYQFNVDELKKMGLDTMYSKGAEIGILDNSCYGGESVATFEDKACVISTQTPRFPSITTMYSENEPLVFGITSVVNLYMKKSNKKLSMEDYYLKSLAEYPSWSALKDPVILSVFPNMSGDYKGNLLSDHASIYSFLSTGDYDYFVDLNNYYQETLCADMVSTDKQQQTASSYDPGYDQCVVELKNLSDEKYKVFENIRYFFSLKKKGLDLSSKAVKDLRSELKSQLDKIRKIDAELKSKEKLLTAQKEAFFNSFNEELKKKRVRVRNCIPKENMAKLVEGSESVLLLNDKMTYKDANRILTENGCEFFKDTNEVECPCCSIHRYLDHPGFFNRSSHDFLVMLDPVVEDLIYDIVFNTDCVHSYVEQAIKATNINNNTDLHRKAEAYELTWDQIYGLKKSIQAETEKFNVAFNKLKAVMYIKSYARAVSPNEAIKRCRKFKI